MDKIRVLIVDDNRDAADSLKLMLELVGHEIQVCENGLEALALARIFLPHIVLLDIGLPSIDGYEVARRLRKQPQRDAPCVDKSSY